MNWLKRASCVLLLFVIPAAAGVISFTDSAAVANKPAVAVVGDSLAWQADSSIGNALPRSGYTYRISTDPGHALSSAWTQSELEEDLQGNRFGIIVIETASNDALQMSSGSESAAQYSQLLGRLLRSAADRCVVVVNAKVRVSPFYYQPHDALAINQIISKAAFRYSDERIVNWNQLAQAHESWFRPDLLHFTSTIPNALLTSEPPTSLSQSAGDKAFARAIVTGIQSCRSGFGHMADIG